MAGFDPLAPFAKHLHISRQFRTAVRHMCWIPVCVEPIEQAPAHRPMGRIRAQIIQFFRVLLQIKESRRRIVVALI